MTSLVHALTHLLVSVFPRRNISHPMAGLCAADTAAFNDRVRTLRTPSAPAVGTYQSYRPGLVAPAGPERR